MYCNFIAELFQIVLGAPYPYMGPPPSPDMALDSENHILRYDVTHAGPLTWGRFAKIIPMSNP